MQVTPFRLQNMPYGFFTIITVLPKQKAGVATNPFPPSCDETKEATVKSGFLICLFDEPALRYACVWGRHGQMLHQREIDKKDL